jgi:hypothetical protein
MGYNIKLEIDKDSLIGCKVKLVVEEVEDNIVLIKEERMITPFQNYSI